jgi:hypothetical protein
MKNDKVLIEALTVFGKGYIEELGKQLKKENKDASGNLLRSLDSRVIKTAMGTLYTIELKAEDYLKYVDGGRRSGTYPPLSAIQKWVDIKGISRSAVFPIMRKIKEKGIKPTNVIQKSLDAVIRGMKFRQFEDDANDWVDDMVSQLIFDLSKNKNKNITVKAK